jgi:hypothetical protein
MASNGYWNVWSARSGPVTFTDNLDKGQGGSHLN